MIKIDDSNAHINLETEYHFLNKNKAKQNKDVSEDKDKKVVSPTNEQG